jgi:hypothetical protein
MAAGQILVAPAAATGISATSGGTVWVFGSYMDIITSTTTEIAIFGVQWQYGRSGVAGVDATREWQLDIATGATSAEVVQLQIPFSLRMDTAAGHALATFENHFLGEPLLVPASTRIACRVAQGFNAAATTLTGIKIYYREEAAAAAEVIPDLVMRRR